MNHEMHLRYDRGGGIQRHKLEVVFLYETCEKRNTITVAHWSEEHVYNLHHHKIVFPHRINRISGNHLPYDQWQYPSQEPHLCSYKNACQHKNLDMDSYQLALSCVQSLTM